MKVFVGLPKPEDRIDTAVAIGNFDGVHLGHQVLIEQINRAARARMLRSAILTFEPHPREFFNPQAAPARILSLRDKIEALKETEIERVNIINFNEKFANISPYDFVKQILVDGMHARFVCVGENFRFGAKREGDFNTLVELGKEFHFEVRAMPLLHHGEGPVSSSRIRVALDKGDFDSANYMLGRPYMLSGKILHGKHLGSMLGFPTINQRILPPYSKAHPAVRGVFAVKVHGIGRRPFEGVASVGRRPTVDNNGEYLLETNIFGIDQDLYGRIAKVEFISKIRDEKKFNSLEELKEAIEADAVKAKQILGILK